MKLKTLSIEDILRLGRVLEIGIKSGKDWVSILKWTAANDSSSHLRQVLVVFCRRLQVDGIEKAIRVERELSKSLEWSVFLELLLQAQHGAMHLSQLFRSYHQVVYKLHQLKKKQKSLLVVPKMQAGMALSLGALFSFVLPLFFPGMFPSFLGLGRYDLFAIGLGLLGLGGAVIFYMCHRPARHHRPALSTTFFFYMVSLFLDSGSDLLTAWNKALDAIEMDPKMITQLRMPLSKPDDLVEFLSRLQKQMPEPWPGILNGLNWTYQSGLDLSSYLKETSAQEIERFTFQWEDEVRRLGVSTLIPLGIFVFPSSMFLLMGPQFLIFFSGM